MAKDDLFRNKVFGWVLKNVSSAFPLKRESGDVKAIREAIRRLRHDSPVVIFPQGTRIIDHTQLTEDKAQEGIGFLVSKAGVPVVPAKVIGSDAVMPPHSRFPRRGQITIIIGKPLYFTGQESYQDISRAVMRAILAL